MPEPTFDIWDQSQLTRLIKRRITTGKENLPSLAEQIAPKVDVQARKVKYRISEVDAFGIGQLRAPDGNPKLYRSSMRYRDEYIELALPDEMERISEDTMLKLLSSDPLIKQSGGVEVVDRGNILAMRNYRRVEAMRWEAFLTGKVTNDMEDSGGQIDFGFLAGHIVTAGTLWSDTANADIVAQVRGWQKVVADDIGAYATKIHMNGDTWELVYNNTKIRALLSTYGRSLLVPTKDEVTKLFREGSEIIIYDGGYRAENSDRVGGVATGAYVAGNLGRGDAALTKWLPYGKVLFTTEYVLDGVPIADTPNGQVMIATGYNSAEPRQGPQAETILHPISKNTMLRYAGAAIPRILIPEAFFVATVA
jgi:hypothetical protein